MPQTKTYTDSEDQKNFLTKLTVAITKKNIEDIPAEELEETILKSYYLMLDWMIENASKNNDLVFSKELKDMKEGIKNESLSPEAFDAKFKRYYLEFLEVLNIKKCS